MGKDTHLVNIYLKIHNKQTLTMDDLAYLAKYSPECFEKTCKNVVYNKPETKKIMEPSLPAVIKQANTLEEYNMQNIKKVLENIRRLETADFPVTNVEADGVKNLLGNLYMELMFPHNDKDIFMNMTGGENVSLFDKRA